MSERERSTTDNSQSAEKETRRQIIVKAAYVAPVVLTLAATPAFAQRGSGPPFTPPGPPRKVPPRK